MCIKMLKYFVLLSLLAFVVNVSVISPRIIGGSDANVEDFPHIGSLRINHVHKCAASVMHHMFVLTAAHCVDGTNPREISIQYASTYLNPDETWYLVDIISYSIHDNYTVVQGEYPKYYNDVAILITGNPIRYTNGSKPIIVAQSDTPLPMNSPATIYGWGYNSNQGSSTNRLQRAEVKLLSAEDCSSELGSDVDTSMSLCSKSVEGVKGECTGDAGGPLVVDGMQRGIISWTAQLCGSSSDVSMNLSEYADWICRKAFCAIE